MICNNYNNTNKVIYISYAIRYQILEAKANGADTILLIVAVLGVNQLKDLITYSRSLGMEPLVEVHTNQEMEIALDSAAKVIGVNNRDLHSFHLDLTTTERMTQIMDRRGLTWRIKTADDPSTSTSTIIPPDILIAALSGITTSEDIKYFYNVGACCCLIGESLMKSVDPEATIQSYIQSTRIGSDNMVDGTSGTSSLYPPIIKVCGMKSSHDVEVALRAGAGLIGVIFAPNSPRTASVEQAIEIVSTVRGYGERAGAIDINPTEKDATVGSDSSVQQALSSEKAWYISRMNALQRIVQRRPLVVGVFQNQSPHEVVQ